ncbi:MAG: hypothetical protein ABGY41_15335 [Candidatus Poribacteria bacterium]
MTGRGYVSGPLIALCFLVLAAPACHAAVLFSDDFESGDLSKWNVVTGSWIVEEEDGNHYARTDGGPFRVMNIAGRTFGDVTITARIWQVTRDHGANIYARNDLVTMEDAQHSGYWFGISGALDASGWGAFRRGGQTVGGVLVASTPLDTWVRLEVTLTGQSATMTAALEGDVALGEASFDIPNIASATGLDIPEGYFGFIVAGEQVRIDDVVVTGAADSVAVQPHRSAAITWASVKSGP